METGGPQLLGQKAAGLPTAPIINQVAPLHLSDNIKLCLPERQSWEAPNVVCGAQGPVSSLWPLELQLSAGQTAPSMVTLNSHKV